LIDSVAAEGKATLYAYFSIALTFPVIAWPFIYQLVFFSSREDFYSSWIIVSGMALLIVIVIDSICSGPLSLRGTAVSLAWLFLLILFVTISLSLWNSIYLIALIYFLHSLRSCLDLWCGRGGWWSWTAWSRDSITALILFLWQPFLILAE